jgi:hypothetical protein
MLFGAGTRQFTIVYILEVPDYVSYGGFDVTYNEWRPVPELGKQVHTVHDVFF